MTNSQRLSVRLSEIRQRLNEVAGLEGDAYTAEIRAENDKLQTEYRDLEGKYRAAVIAEGDAEKRALETEPDAELRERRELRGKASLGAYLLAALSGRRVDGPEARAARGVQGWRGDSAGIVGHGPARAPGRLGHGCAGDGRGEFGPDSPGSLCAVDPAAPWCGNAACRVGHLRQRHYQRVLDGWEPCQGSGGHGQRRRQPSRFKV